MKAGGRVFLMLQGPHGPFFDRLGRLLAALPPLQRRVVVLRYLHDLPEKDVATELGVPLGTVKSSAARGLAALRTALEGQQEERSPR